MSKSHRVAESKPDKWLRFVMGSPLCRWTSPDGKERVYLIARHDGGFGSGSEYFSDDKSEMCWMPIGAGGSIYSSEEIAVREIQISYPWLKQVARENYS